MKKNDIEMFDNNAKIDAKIDPESTNVDAKNDTVTVLGASWRYPGHHRAFYSKTVSGDYSFRGGLWVTFGAQGRPKASATLFSRTFWGGILDQKVEKRHPKRHAKIDTENTSKNYAKRLPK